MAWTLNTTLPVARALPERIESLIELSLDLRWTWSHASDKLWRTLDAQLWDHTKNPWLVLNSVSQRRLELLSRDREFTEELDRLSEARRQYQSCSTWCEESHPQACQQLVAYFSMEYGLGEALPLYSGGLGVLAGDFLKTASDLGVPMVAVGLLYEVGFFRQMLDSNGWQLELHPPNVPATLPVTPARDAEGARLVVQLELPGRTLYLQVWEAVVGRVRLYLLDSNDPSNLPADRGITGQLYGGDLETRFMQEIVLGVGGWRALEKLNIKPAICHLNEGHAALVALERIRSYTQAQGVGFTQALWTMRAGNVFTTHTTVAAAFDVFPEALLAKYGRPYIQQMGISTDQLLSLGRRDPENHDEPFNMAFLAARTCSHINGVSRLHGQVSRQIFSCLYPRWPDTEVPIGHITNGVHVPSWDSAWADELWTNACGKQRWLGSVESLATAIDALSDEALWNFRGNERADLVRYARQRLARQAAQQGLEARGNALDPNVLTLGFARRFTEYKRPHLLLKDPDRLERLLTNPARPVQIILAGKAHPKDESGKQLIQQWAQFVRRPAIRPHAVYLEDYDIPLAQEMVQGADVWINTPRRPWEASGTSGMKVLVNGGLNLSELDGWWAEAYESDLGWAIGDGKEHTEADHDDREAQQLFNVLEQQIVPEFYERDTGGIPRAWVARMRASMARLAPQFSSTRMLQQYVREVYVPAFEAYGERRDGQIAHSLAAWEGNLRAHWREVRLASLVSSAVPQGWHFTVQAYLGAIGAHDVRVQLFADPLENAAAVMMDMEIVGQVPGAQNGFVYSVEVRSERPQSHFTPRIVPWHPQARLPIELSLIRWLE